MSEEHGTSIVERRPAETLTGFVAAVLILLTAFGVHLHEGQIAAILGVVGFLPTIVSYAVDRRKS